MPEAGLAPAVEGGGSRGGSSFLESSAGIPFSADGGPSHAQP